MRAVLLDQAVPSEFLGELVELLLRDLASRALYHVIGVSDDDVVCIVANFLYQSRQSPLLCGLRECFVELIQNILNFMCPPVLLIHLFRMALVDAESLKEVSVFRDEQHTGVQVAAERGVPIDHKDGPRRKRRWGFVRIVAVREVDSARLRPVNRDSRSAFVDIARSLPA